MGEVEADDQHLYYIKGDAHGRPVRASEWICNHLAEEIHIGAPAPMVIERLNGETVFGSRRIGGVSDQIITARYLLTQTYSNVQSSAPGLQAILSSIYAMDMFLFNDDRHLGNYLTIDDNGVRRLYAFDFSRALYWHWPWQGFPPLSSNTRKCGSILWQMHGFDPAAAMGTLDRIAGLAPATLQGFISRMPSDWLPDPIRAELMDWWGNGGRTSRLQTLRMGITDGTLL